VVVTESILRAAYVFDPPPFVFDSLAHPSATLGGCAVRARLCPPPALEHAVLTAHQVQLFWRPRRAGRGEQRMPQLEREVRFLAPELRHRECAGSVTFRSGEGGSPEPEATLIARFHDELDALRPTLQGSVDARRAWHRP
jgi:hypothetical protein